ncbi:hypothetical protein ANO11243_027570 [Dothideomycetidae sp. 11243]|nr:hypothetical protein ANO11243_027570 [fungal sp. No.11243]
MHNQAILLLASAMLAAAVPQVAPAKASTTSSAAATCSAKTIISTVTTTVSASAAVCTPKTIITTMYAVTTTTVTHTATSSTSAMLTPSVTIFPIYVGSGMKTSSSAVVDAGSSDTSMGASNLRIGATASMGFSWEPSTLRVIDVAATDRTVAAGDEGSGTHPDQVMYWHLQPVNGTFGHVVADTLVAGAANGWKLLSCASQTGSTTTLQCNVAGNPWYLAAPTVGPLLLTNATAAKGVYNMFSPPLSSSGLVVAKCQTGSSCQGSS